MILRALFFPALLAVLPAGPVSAAWVGYQYTGVVFFVHPNPTVAKPFGHTITNFTPVSGHFIYNTNSPAVFSDGESVRYLQHYPGGLTTHFGSLTISADHYIVVVSKDVEQLTDVLGIRYDSTLTPPLAGPLVVDGVEHSEGILRLSLTAAAGQFPDHSLPETLDFGDFSSDFNFLSAPPNLSSPAVMFMLNSLQSMQVADFVPVPEPASGLMLGLGLLLLWIVSFGRRGSREAGGKR